MTGTPYPKKWTYSTWIKRCTQAVEDYILYAVDGGGTNKTHVTFAADGRFRLYNTISGSTSNNFRSSRKFRDPGAWYHIVIIWDTANVTTADRCQLWVNGVRETAFDDETLNDENGTINTAVEHQVSGYATSSYIDGVMAHTHFCDNQVYDASYFGEIDSTSGIWVPKTGPSVTYGDNGFFLKYASGAFGTDSSGESNDFVVTGTMTNTKDTPENNFCTMNPLQNEIPNATFTQGNNTIKTDFNAPPTSTIGLDSGKWYCEGKCIVTTSGTDWQIGINSNYMDGTGNELGHFANDWAYQGSDGNSRTNNTSTSYGDTYTTGDIIGIALDLTNNKLYFSKNGVWQDSGDPTSGATGTGALSISLGTGAQAKGYFFIAAGADSSAQDYTWSMNFGNGYFGTTAISSGNADDAGEGDFEYDVPAGYYALCTNNLGDQS